jgi:hypothetical protein
MTNVTFMLISIGELYGGLSCLEVLPLDLSCITIFATYLRFDSHPVTNCLYVIT